MKCIIPCAGESSRMAYIPKMLIRIKGEPLISHIVEFWKDKVDGFIFVVRRKDTFYWDFFPANSAIVFQDEPKGLADAILKAEPYVGGNFVIALGDCLYRGVFSEEQMGFGIGVWSTYNVKEVEKSYLVEVRNGTVSTVEEKPKVSMGSRMPMDCGMGVYFMDSTVFHYIRKSNAVPGGGDFTLVLQEMIDHGISINPVWFSGKYINVGSPEDIAMAEEILNA